MPKMGWKLVHSLDSSMFPQLIVTPLLTKHRILTQVAANNADIVKILPPLIIGEKEIDRFITALDEVIARSRQIPRPRLGNGPEFRQGHAQRGRTRARAGTIGWPSLIAVAKRQIELVRRATTVGIGKQDDDLVVISPRRGQATAPSLHDRRRGKIDVGRQELRVALVR